MGLRQSLATPSLEMEYLSRRLCSLLEISDSRPGRVPGEQE